MRERFFLLMATVAFLFFPRSIFAQVVVNEFSAHSQPDWVELYNTGDKIIDLEGWQIRDETVTNKINLWGLICPQGFRRFDFSNRLNNGGDKIRLVNENGETVEEIAYFSEVIPEHKSNQSTGRKESGSNDWVVWLDPTPQDEDCFWPTLTPTPIILTPTLVPTAVATPTPMLTPTPVSTKAFYQINEVKNEEGDILSSVKIYIDDKYTHHYAPEILEFCEGCYCDDNKEVECGLGDHTIRLEKNGYQDWKEAKTINAGSSYRVDPIMMVIKIGRKLKQLMPEVLIGWIR